MRMRKEVALKTPGARPTIRWTLLTHVAEFVIEALSRAQVAPNRCAALARRVGCSRESVWETAETGGPETGGQSELSRTPLKRGSYRNTKPMPLRGSVVGLLACRPKASSEIAGR